MRRDMKFFAPWFIMAMILVPSLAKSETNWEDHRDEIVKELQDSGKKDLSKEEKVQLKAMAECVADKVLIPLANKTKCAYNEEIGAAQSLDICVDKMSEKQQLLILTGTFNCVAAAIL